jgi:hypothetical protein
MVQREGERGRRKRGGARAPRRTQDFFSPLGAGPFSFSVRAFPSVLTPPPDENLSFLTGARSPLDSGGRRCSPGRPPAARPPPQRTTVMLGAGAAARRGGLILPGERGRLPGVDFGVPCGLLVRLLDRR